MIIVPTYCYNFELYIYSLHPLELYRKMIWPKTWFCYMFEIKLFSLIFLKGFFFLTCWIYHLYNDLIKLFNFNNFIFLTYLYIILDVWSLWRTTNCFFTNIKSSNSILSESSSCSICWISQFIESILPQFQTQFPFFCLDVNAYWYDYKIKYGYNNWVFWLVVAFRHYHLYLQLKISTQKL